MNDDRIVRASGRRLLLALFIEYNLFGAAWGVAWHFVDPTRESIALEMLAFALFELIAFWRWGSPGAYFLSIEAIPIGSFQYLPNEKLAVDPAVIRCESWFSMLVGVVMIVSGAKEFCRWTLWSPPAPHFGYESTAEFSALISMFFGVAEVYCGYLILKMRKLGWHAVLALSAVYLTDIFLSWDLLDQFAIDYLNSKAEFVGKNPPNESQIELVQAVFPEAVLIGVVAILFAVALISRRMRNK